MVDIQNDKAQHTTYGNLIMLAVLPIVYWLWRGHGIETVILISFSIVAIVGIGKEIYDRQHQDEHTADVWDAIATSYQPMMYVTYFILWRLYG